MWINCWNIFKTILVLPLKKYQKVINESWEEMEPMVDHEQPMMTATFLMCFFWVNV